MIRIVYDRADGQHTVSAYCDVCGEPITDVALAGYAWDGLASDASNGTPPMFFHKTKCDPERLGLTKDWGAWYWDELSRFPVYLGNALDVDWDQSHKTAKFAALL